MQNTAGNVRKLKKKVEQTVPHIVFIKGTAPVSFHYEYRYAHLTRPSVQSSCSALNNSCLFKFSLDLVHVPELLFCNNYQEGYKKDCATITLASTERAARG